jgi:hypothetical protein
MAPMCERLGQIPVPKTYAGLPLACRMASDEIRLPQNLGGDDGGREPVDAA